MRTREKPRVSSAVSQTTMISIHSKKTQYKIFAWFQSPYINQAYFFSQPERHSVGGAGCPME